MPENPLLPHAELKALLARTKQCTALEKASSPKTGSKPRRGAAIFHSGREAVLAATTLQLAPGDLIVPSPGDRLLANLPPVEPGINQPVLPDDHTKCASRLLLAVAMAAAIKETRTNRIVLAFTHSGSSDPAWQAALTWAQERLLPILLVCTDASGATVFTQKLQTPPTSLQWGAVSRLAAKQKLPILTVDGEDAVAMYRATQEAVLRARSGGGPAVLWAALPTFTDLADRSRNLQPVNRLAQYLRTRGIPLS